MTMVEQRDVPKFFGRVDKGGPVHRTLQTPCWLWTGKLSVRGYGLFRIRTAPCERKWIFAHRWSWEFANEQAIQEGLIVRHHCDNPRCVNPHHLCIGTHADNARDRVVRCRSQRGSRHPINVLKARVAELEAENNRLRSLLSTSTNMTDLGGVREVQST